MCAHDIHLIIILEIYLSRYPFLTKNSLMSFCKKYLIKCCFREIFNKYPCVSKINTNILVVSEKLTLMFFVNILF